MYRSLYFKIILIFVVFMMTVMAVVGTVLLNSVFSYNSEQFLYQMDQYFGGSLRLDLTRAMSGGDWVTEQKSILKAYGASLGIDNYRNYYILDANGEYLDGSSGGAGVKLEKTPNILTAMAGSDGKTQLLGSDYNDYTVYLSSGGKECIIYIKDTQEELQQLSWQLFTIIIQSVFFGLLIAVILSFFLAKAITGPIHSLTIGAKRIAEGEFDRDIEVHSQDEIGTLTETFNHMGRVLKRTLEEVSGERQKLETVFSYLSDAVIAFSDTGNILNINKRAAELFGGSLGQDFNIEQMFELLTIEYPQSEIKALGAGASHVIRNVQYNGRVLDVSIGILKYIDNNSSHTGSITVMHDITERYELDKAQREFVANVSHELRTPLTGIRGATESILFNPDMPRDFREGFLNMAVEECDCMLRIIDDLLTLSRFDNKRTRWKPVTFSIKKSLVHVCEVMRADADSRGHEINLEVAENLPDITADKEKIEQVLINIVSNAVKYTPDNGRIDIRALVEGDNIKIHVRDNGIGIPEDDMGRLFERFYRVEKSRTAGTGGTGLGLAIAKEITEAHGGSVTIKSKYKKGTIVTVVLPVISKIAGSEENESGNIS